MGDSPWQSEREGNSSPSGSGVTEPSSCCGGIQWGGSEPLLSVGEAVLSPKKLSANLMRGAVGQGGVGTGICIYSTLGCRANRKKYSFKNQLGR